MKKNNEYLNSFGNIILLMKLFGVFPFASLHQEKTRVSFSKTLTIFSTSIYIIVLHNQLCHQYQQLANVSKNLNIILFICVLPVLTFRIAMIIVPITIWRRSSQLHLFWDDWMNFQIQMEKLTGIPFQLSMKKMVLVVNFVGIICTCAAAMMLNRLHELCLASPPNNVAVCYLAVVLSSILLYWFTNNMYAKQAAKKIQDLTRESLRARKSDNLRIIVDLWMELCDLNERFSDIHSVLFLFMFSVAVMDIVAHIYLAVLLLINDPDKLTGFSYLYVSCCNIIIVMLLCEPANSFSNHINNHTKEVLLNEKTTNMNVMLKRMIVLFLRTIEIRNPKVTFYGYITVNRSTILTIFGTVINYLIILKQLIQTEMGNSEEIISHPNPNGNETGIVTA